MELFASITVAKDQVEKSKTVTMAKTNLNPSWQTSNNLLSSENFSLMVRTKSGLGFVNGSPKNNPEKLLCTVLFTIVPILSEKHLNNTIKTRIETTNNLK
ncbi:hypothetical protein DsansV1_C46g0242041 [Dioscorea sansibarensis]